MTLVQRRQTPSAPTGLNASRGFRPPQLVHHAPHIVMVEFTAPDGRTWQAIGGGRTLADAIVFAQGSCPADATWRPVGWSDLYGD